MKCSILSMAWLALGAAVAVGSASGAASGHPVEQVIDLLKDLMVQTKKEGEEEEYLYGKLEHWCENSKETLGGAIKKEKETLDKLADLIAAKKEETSVLAKQIETLSDELLELDSQDKKATALRTKENNLYKFTDKELKQTISSVKEALALLLGAEEKTASAALIAKARRSVKAVVALVEVHTTAEQQSTLLGFATPDERVDALEAKGDRSEHVKNYEFKGGKVIELLKQLVAKFEADSLEVVKAETNAVNAYELAKSARADETAATDKAKSEKLDTKEEAESTMKKALEDQASTQSDLDADSALLSETEQKCTTKDSQWAERSKMRDLELEAMETAIKILAEVTGVRSEQPTNPVPPTSPLDFLQLRRSTGSKPDASARALQLLRQAAKAAKSQALERFAQEVSAHLGGPFDEVNNMMEKMIYRLMDEQKDEDEHKHWCDLEVNKTDASLIDKDDKISELKAKIAKSKAYTQELSDEITDATEMVAKVEMHMKESAEIREVAHKENMAAIKDSQDAQTAIANAIAVLETHYKESGMIAKESWEEFVQTKNRAPTELPDDPSTWTAGYTGVTDPTEAGTGIISVLQKTNQNFVQMETDTTMEEESDVKFYEEEMKECAIEKATRLKESEVKEQEKKRQVEKTATLTSEKKHVEDEYETTSQYLADLQKACVEGGSTYLERKANRQKEIDALHQAKDILKEAFEPSAASFLQQRRKKALRRA